MKKENLAKVLTALLILAVLGIVFGKKLKWSAPQFPAISTAAPTSPQDTIYAMLDSARAGDVKQYLSYFAGDVASALRQQLRESGENAFAGYLQSTQSGVKGVALNEPQVLTDREVKVRVEFVYQDRNEIQFMTLEKSNSAWKITKLDSAERVKTLVPYGTPVQ